MVEHFLGKEEVTGSIPVISSTVIKILIKTSGSNSVGRVTAFQAVGREFESRLPLKEDLKKIRLQQLDFSFKKKEIGSEFSS